MKVIIKDQVIYIHSSEDLRKCKTNFPKCANHIIQPLFKGRGNFEYLIPDMDTFIQVVTILPEYKNCFRKRLLEKEEEFERLIVTFDDFYTAIDLFEADYSLFFDYLFQHPAVLKRLLVKTTDLLATIAMWQHEKTETYLNKLIIYLLEQPKEFERLIRTERALEQLGHYFPAQKAQLEKKWQQYQYARELCAISHAKIAGMYKTGFKLHASVEDYPAPLIILPPMVRQSG